MRKKHLQIIKSLLQNYENNMIDVAVISGYGSFCVSRDEIEGYVKDADLQMLYYSYNEEGMKRAYEPFLGWIRDIYNEVLSKEYTIEDFFKESNVYPVQMKAFEEFIVKGKLKRFEEYIWFQGIADYEEARFIDSVIGMMETISKKKRVCIFLDRLHLAGESTIKLILEMYRNKEKNKNILLIGSIDENYRLPIYMRNEWNNLIEQCRKEDVYFEADYSEEFENIVYSSYTIQEDQIKKELDSIIEMMASCAYEQAEYYLSLIYTQIKSKYDEKSIPFDSLLWDMICFLLTFCHTYCGRNTQALEILEDITEIEPDYESFYKYNESQIKHNEKILKKWYCINYLYYWINMSNMNLYNISFKHACNCIKIAELLNIDHLLFRARFARDLCRFLFIEWYCPTEQRWHRNKESKSYYESMINQAFDRNQKSIAAVYMSCAFENTKEELQLIENDEAEFTHFYDAVTLIARLDNLHLLSHVHDYKTLLAYHYEFNNVSIKINRLCNEYMSKEEDRIVENGYSYTLKEQYSISHKVNNRKLNYLFSKYLNSKSEIKTTKDYFDDNYYLSEVAGTLLDMAKDNIYMHNYGKAERYISVVISVIDNINKPGLFNASRGLLYSLRAYCGFFTEKIYQCYEDIDRAEAFFSHILSGDRNDKAVIAYGDTFYYNLVKGKLEIYEGNNDKAQMYFDKAFDIFSNTENEYLMTYDVICVEQAKLYRSIGRSDLAVKVLAEGRDFYLEIGMTKRAGYLISLIEGRDYIIEKMEYELKGVQTQDILKASFDERKELQIKEERDCNLFITSWLELLNSDNSNDDIVPVSIDRLKNMFNMNYAIYIDIGNAEKSERILYRDFDYIVTEKDVDIISEYFEKNPVPFCITRVQKKYKTISSIVNIFGTNEIEIIVGVPVMNKEKIGRICIMIRSLEDYIKVSRDNFLLEKRYETLKLALAQLYDTENRIENLKLEEYRINLEIAAKTAEEASRSKSNFLANMSHEIRTPLNAIMGMSEIALQEQLADSTRENIENIISAGNTLLAIINDILDFSKIEAGKMEIVNTHYQLSSIICDINNMMIFRIADKPIKLIFNVEADIPNELYGDEVRIRQIFINIINNAIKFTNKGSITVNIRWKRQDNIAILHVDVIDTGMGIKQDELGRLFTSFERVDIKRNRQLEGTGLGLAICKQLLTIMEGKISVVSEYGKGSTFSFELPQKIIDDAAIYGNAVNSMSNVLRNDESNNDIILPDAKILVVDDNEMNLKVTKGLLKTLQCKVVTCLSGRECIERVKRTMQADRDCYDMIFLDHMMPDMDGIETLTELKELEGFCVPVIALTANAISGVKDMYLEKGFSDYLSKPINRKSLKNIICKYLTDKVIYTDEVDQKDD